MDKDDVDGDNGVLWINGNAARNGIDLRREKAIDEKMLSRFRAAGGGFGA